MKLEEIRWKKNKNLNWVFLRAIWMKDLRKKKNTYSFSFTPPLSDLASLQSSKHNPPLDFCAALPMVLLLWNFPWARICWAILSSQKSVFLGGTLAVLHCRPRSNRTWVCTHHSLPFCPLSSPGEVGRVGLHISFPPVRRDLALIRSSKNYRVGKHRMGRSGICSWRHKEQDCSSQEEKVVMLNYV